jgi:hypothetical protein
MNEGVPKLILKRFVSKFSYIVWSILSIFIFTLLLGLIMYFLSTYDCPARRALGYAVSPRKSAANRFFRHPWKQDCEAKGENP